MKFYLNLFLLPTFGQPFSQPFSQPSNDFVPNFIPNLINPRVGNKFLLYSGNSRIDK